jgi:hypothetical protein
MMKNIDLDAIFSATAGDVRRHFFRLAPLMLLVAIAVNLFNETATGWFGADAELEQSMDALIGMLLVFATTSMLAFGFYIVLAGNLLRDARLDAGSAALRVLRCLPAMLLTLLAFYIAILLGFILLIVPGLILMVTLGYCWFLVLLDDAGPIDALSGSFRLVWGNAWLVFAANVLWALAYLCLFAAVLYFLPGSFGELIALIGDGASYGDWRRWVFDVIGVVCSIAYLFLNLRIFEDLKRVRRENAADSSEVMEGGFSA